MTELYTEDKGGPAYTSVASQGPLPPQAAVWAGSDTQSDATMDEIERGNGEHVVTDDLELLLSSLPATIIEPLRAIGNRANLLEVVMDLGRKPEARHRVNCHLRNTRHSQVMG